MHTQQPSRLDDELPGTPPAEQPERPPPVHGPDPEPIPEKLPGEPPVPGHPPTETPAPMHVQQAPATPRNDDEEGTPTVIEAQPRERRLIGNSEAMDAVRRMIVRVAPTDSAVLICGESGCGKELVAESLHAASPRADGPFVAINCGAIPPTLIEAELFGHEKGSFTGASRTHAGVFERANDGTLLLDEFTEMPLEMQARLLRVLETKRVRRVGAEVEIPVNVRVLAATNRCPVEAVEAGHLREDIYYRLAVVLIRLPPLRERGEDILALAEYFLADLNRRQRHAKRFSAAMRERLVQYDWPGNVRQLRNAVERAFVLCDEVLDVDHEFGAAPARNAANGAGGGARRSDPSSITLPIGSSLDDIERTFIVATLEHFGGDKRRAASALGCSVKTLYNKLHLYRRQLGHVAAAS
ncbi:MAG TPA: sigma 54-interacting transcriptional regulator [Steroidobacteraceae bacterium]|nr:sigma 54-interacting transcriptional regulator [Steroidobacteraceae bacterium]